MSNICGECGEEVEDDEYLVDEEMCLACDVFFRASDDQRDDEFEQSIASNVLEESDPVEQEAMCAELEEEEWTTEELERFRALDWEGEILPKQDDESDGDKDAGPSPEENDGG